MLLGADYRGRRATRSTPTTLIFTGPIDEYFDHRYGKLPYRSLRFRHETLDQRAVPAGRGRSTIPIRAMPYTRITEYKHLTGQSAPQDEHHLRISRAPTATPTIRCRGRRTRRSTSSTRRWRSSQPDVTFVGRLATYRYYNMDQVVGQALATFRKLDLRRSLAGDEGKILLRAAE